MKPLIKWVGGKRGLVPDLVEVWEGGEFKRLIEPFAGAASLFFRAEPEKAVLVDTCEPLMNFYKVLRSDPGKLNASFVNLMKHMPPKSMKKQEKRYYVNREKFNSMNGAGSAAGRAALFLFLNRHCFQGLWRVNKQGKMNAAYGHYAKPHIPTKEEIADVSVSFKGAKLIRGDFEKGLTIAGKGDLVYCDPPYLDSFDGYTKEDFGLEEHKRLADGAHKAVKKGAVVIVSNRDHKDIHKLYPKSRWTRFKVEGVQRIAPHNKGKNPEIIMVSK